MLTPHSTPYNYQDLMTSTPYKALSDIKLVLKSGGETTIRTDTIFYLFPDMGSGRGVMVSFSRFASYNDPQNLFIDPNCKGLT